VDTVGTSDPRTLGAGVAIGVDWGATLAKLALRRPDGTLEYELLPTEDADASRAVLAALGARRIGLTGGGATMLARSLSGEVVQVNEFAAWGAGASALLPDGVQRYLLVSVGTGTSVLLVDGVDGGELEPQGLAAAADRDLRQAGADVGSDPGGVLRGIHSLFRSVTFPARLV
jgi:hypothetical protein